MQAAKRDKCATHRRYTDLSVMGFRVGVALSEISAFIRTDGHG